MFHQHTSSMGQPISVRDLASALVAAPEEQRKTMLGVYLHPLVYEIIKHDEIDANLVTEMILDMGEAEVLHLLESPPHALESEVFKKLDKLVYLDDKLAALQALKSRKDDLCSLALARKHTKKEAHLGKIHQEALASALLYTPPEKCKTIFREHRPPYPTVDQLEHENADKVTEFIWNMDTLDHKEVLRFLDSPEEFKAEVLEAMKELGYLEKQDNRPAVNTTGYDQDILDEYVYLEHVYETEMNATKVSHLQHSVQALQANVQEAMEMLTIIQEQTNSLASQLSSLSYKDSHAF